MKITSFTCWTLELDRSPAFIWRNGLPVSDSDLPQGKSPKHAVIRMDTDEGIFGAVMRPHGDALIDTVRRRYHHFIGENPMLSERMWKLLWEVDRIEEFNIRTLGILDILCWDVKSKKADIPIYQMLGGDDPDVPAYASTVTWPTLGEYERYIKMSRDIGFKAFKLHAWGDVKRDIELCHKLREWVGPDADLMFDGSAGWDYVDALKVGRVLQDLGFLWYEEPMREFYLGAYTKLADKLDIPILAAETSDGAHWNMATWIQDSALDMTRISTQMKGGFTGSMKIAHTSESFGMRAQVHGGGYANAQLCAAVSNNDYYEQLIINEEQIKALPEQNDLPIKDGVLSVSENAGVGEQFDFDELDRTAIEKFHVAERFE